MTPSAQRNQIWKLIGLNIEIIIISTIFEIAEWNNMMNIKFLFQIRFLEAFSTEKLSCFIILNMTRFAIKGFLTIETFNIWLRHNNSLLIQGITDMIEEIGQGRYQWPAFSSWFAKPSLAKHDYNTDLMFCLVGGD
jgi:hypothetical protein